MKRLLTLACLAVLLLPLACTDADTAPPASQPTAPAWAPPDTVAGVDVGSLPPGAEIVFATTQRGPKTTIGGSREEVQLDSRHTRVMTLAANHTGPTAGKQAQLSEGQTAPNAFGPGGGATGSGQHGLAGSVATKVPPSRLSYIPWYWWLLGAWVLVLIVACILLAVPNDSAKNIGKSILWLVAFPPMLLVSLGQKWQAKQTAAAEAKAAKASSAATANQDHLTAVVRGNDAFFSAVDKLPDEQLKAMDGPTLKAKIKDVFKVSQNEYQDSATRDAVWNARA